MPEDGNTIPAETGTKWAGLKGFAVLEKFMTDLDNGMVNDFNDDINTLLTFAGLFSAVLTAFLIESYKWLQPDSSSTTNSILGQISQQIANPSLPPVDSQAGSNFQPAASSVSINTLWFLALVLSLAAALFGMMAKQWLRQYLRWTTMSGPSETQVALRQIRYDALRIWQMPAIIASIPALLEIALILFLTGMDILLWTLNGVVFGVCTVAVAVLIILAFVTTVMPVFFPRCPYKSPAGWACLLAWQAVARFWNRSMGLLQFLLRWLGHRHFWAYHYHIPATNWKDWRERDLKRDCRLWHISEAAPGDNTKTAMYTRQDEFIETSVVNDAASCIQVLHRALRWITDTSQDMRLLRAVEESVPSHTTRNWHSFSRLILHFHDACQALHIDPRSLVPSERDCVEVGSRAAVIDVHASDFSHSGVSYRMWEGEDGWHARQLHVDEMSPVASSLRVQLANTIANDLLTILDAGEDVITSYGKQATYYLQGSALLGAFLTWTAVYEERRTSIATDLFAALLDRFASDAAKLPISSLPLMRILFLLILVCEYRLDCRLFLISAGNLRRTQIALKLPPGDPTRWSQAEGAFFVDRFSKALKEWEAPHDLVSVETMLPPLMNRMAGWLERALILKLKDCGVPRASFYWPWHLRRFFDPSYELYNGRQIPLEWYPHRLVDALARCHHAGLITDEQSSSDTEALLRRSQELQRDRSTQQSGSSKPPGDQLESSVQQPYSGRPSAPPSPSLTGHNIAGPLENPVTSSYTPLLENSSDEKWPSGRFNALVTDVPHLLQTLPRAQLPRSPIRSPGLPDVQIAMHTDNEDKRVDPRKQGARLEDVQGTLSPS